jgi:hypothetical protein
MMVLLHSRIYAQPLELQQSSGAGGLEGGVSGMEFDPNLRHNTPYTSNSERSQYRDLRRIYGSSSPIRTQCAMAS